MHNCPKNVDATFWDGVVGVSQLKAATQYMAGDRNGAAQTNRNFWNQMPVVSQMKSLGQILIGRGADAQVTQAIFLRDTIEPILDSTPVVGHAKAYVHLFMGGDKEHAYKILRASTVSSVILFTTLFFSSKYSPLIILSSIFLN